MGSTKWFSFRISEVAKETWSARRTHDHLDCYSVYRSQGAKRSKSRLVLISGHGDEEIRLQALRAGAVEFLTKPFDRKVLLDCVRAALNS